MKDLYSYIDQQIYEMASDVSNHGSISYDLNSSNVKDYDRYSSVSKLALKNLKIKNKHRLVIKNLKNNFISKKFDSIKLVIQGIVVVFVINETKTDLTFLLNQFKIQGY